MSRLLIRAPLSSLLVLAFSLLLARSADARDRVLQLPVAKALAEPAAQAIVGGLPLRFGAASAANADLAASDVQIDGSAQPLHDAAFRSRTPSDEGVCQHAFEDAMARLVAAARESHAVAVLGIVSDYRGQVTDEPAAYVCHAGTFRSYVSLRAQLARTRPHTLPVPAKSGYAELSDLEALPSTAAGKERYAHFLTLPKPRAFVFLDDGSWRFWADDPDAMTKALDDCARIGRRCWLYAVDDNVVWNADEGRRIGSVAQLRGRPVAALPPTKDEHQ